MASGHDTASDQRNAALAAEIDEVLGLLDDYRQDADCTASDPLPRLLEQCKTLCRDLPSPEPVRCLHHLACTGGSVIAETVAALPSVVLLPDIDPLSRLDIARPGARPRFAPSDVIHALKHAPRKVDDAVIVETFRSSIACAATSLERRGQVMVLSEHSHSQFCTVLDPESRPTLREMLRGSVPTLSLVSVRHPLDSLVCLRARGWGHFMPSSLEEYSRRATAFLDRHEGCAILRYEDFRADPAASLTRICEILSLPHAQIALDHLPGDNGHGAPSRPEIPPDLEAERHSAVYAGLCERLDYEP